MKSSLVPEAGTILAERPPVTDFYKLTFDSLLAQVAILRADGTILAVNAAWNAFATRNGLDEGACGPGVNYLQVCEQATGPSSEGSQLVARGIRDVASGRIPYLQLEYPCHSSVEQRWFSVSVTRFDLGAQVRIVVTHDNITERMLAEIRLRGANHVLEAQATTDGLTGVGNRRHFDQILAHEWERHTRSRAPLSVLLVDVDHFKKYNDSRGHLAGDDCLREVAQTIGAVVGRPGDLVARYGGEEFAVILPETDRAGSLAVAGFVAERLRYRRLPHPGCGAGPFVTISIGCSTMVPSREVPASQILERADHALYQAKTEGRDRYIHAD